MENEYLPDNIWEEVKEKIRAQVNDQSFLTWFAPTAQESYKNGSLVVNVPNKFFKDWLSENYKDIVQETASAMVGRECTVLFRIKEGKQRRAAEDSRQLPLPEVRSLQHGLPALNPKYTFESFVVGSSNQFCPRRLSRRRAVEIPDLQPPLHLRRSRARQDAPAPRHRLSFPRQEPGRQNNLHLLREVHERADQLHPL